MKRRIVWRMSRAHTYSHSRAHSPTFPSLHLRHISFFNPSVALSTSQLIFQPFSCFTYVTAHSPTLLSLLLRHRLFTYVTWRDAHACVVFGGGPEIVLTTHSGRPVLVYLSNVQSVASRTDIRPTGIWVVSPGGGKRSNTKS